MGQAARSSLERIQHAMEERGAALLKEIQSLIHDKSAGLSMELRRELEKRCSSLDSSAKQHHKSLSELELACVHPPKPSPKKQTKRKQQFRRQKKGETEKLADRCCVLVIGARKGTDVNGFLKVFKLSFLIFQ
eukprot:NODE_7882_length_434_cov_19.592208_g7024_i0.p1 GENE.NODE_7882_length_434_cov_19.592208_g7024_i0~~NODE_7882_length_434_cov_19.592208_g7024_i0.p1  ORF type:complete len:141 (-),score=46.24 NODE_7882_length_434_cov_19.592208_g7024_i0:10-408(-)